jgi:hypothetical protein
MEFVYNLPLEDPGRLHGSCQSLGLEFALCGRLRLYDNASRPSRGGASARL